MNMFGFQLKITPGSAKTVTPIFVKITENGVSQKMRNFSFPRNFHEKSLFSQLEDANSEKMTSRIEKFSPW